MGPALPKDPQDPITPCGFGKFPIFLLSSPPSSRHRVFCCIQTPKPALMGKTFPRALCSWESGGEQGSVVGAAPRGQGAAMAGMQGAGLVVPFSPCFRGKKKVCILI